jgi:LuxR family maltose regulon positive regulatory protein
MAQEMENLLHPAADTYNDILRMIEDPSHMGNYTAHMGLARISYEWNDLDAALQHAQQAAGLVVLIECESPAEPAVLLSRLKLAQGDAAGAATLLEWAEKSARRRGFEGPIPEVAAARVRVLLHLGKMKAAAHLAEETGLPASLARVRLAQGDPCAAFEILDPLLKQADAGGPGNEKLRLMALAALALHARGERDAAVRLMGGALTLAEPGGYIRLFLDEGAPMAELLSDTLAHGTSSEYAEKILATFQAGGVAGAAMGGPAMAAPGIQASGSQAPMEALSRREMEVLKLIAKGLSNQEIAEHLFISLSTVKGHNQSIFEKLQVQRRAEAMVRARDLGLA